MSKSPNPSALITGGSRGIGLGCATALAREGYDLMIAGRRPPADCQPALDQLRAFGTQIHYAVCDVADANQRHALIAAAREKFPRLNLLVNNAGMAPRVRADLLDATEDVFEEVLRANLQGPYFLTQACARWMVEQKQSDPSFRAAIINISSISATVVSLNRGEYCVSKAGVSMATQLWARRHAEFDLPVFEIRPGVIATDMTSGVQAKYDAVIASGGLPIPRWGQPSDIARAVASLARGDFPYATGLVLNVDGGMTIPCL
jgi:NAD(P)-dependent dehydrogenase (short-subunit alcohol dehydrogenase family)